jgi:hypothetical protein
MHPGLAIIIPTRNRSKLLPIALRGVLEIAWPSIEILVSDNSTDADELQRNQSYCTTLQNPNLRYIRPPQPLGMSQHWEFAIGQTNAEYISVPSDRIYLWHDLFEIGFREMIARGAEALSYGSDQVLNLDELGLRIDEPHLETRQFVEVPGYSLLEDFARGYYPVAAPRLANSIIKRSLLERMRNAAGHLCGGFSPDIYFACLALTQIDTGLHYHAKVFTGFGNKESNGTSFTTGVLSDAAKDFLSQKQHSLLAKSPYPTVMSQANGMINEFLGVMEIVGKNKMPPVQWQVATQAMVRSAELLVDGEFKRQQWRNLYEYGLVRSPIPPRQRRTKERMTLDALRWLCKRVPLFSQFLDTVWNLLSSVFGLRLRLSPRRFSSVTEALEYRSQHQRRLARKYRPDYIIRYRARVG